MADGGPPQTRLFFVRHGRVHNPDELAYGHLPRFGLDAEGRAQAHAAGRWLSPVGLCAVYTSPLLRARQTARIILGIVGTLPLHRARPLRESELARHWQGIPWPEIERVHPELYALFETTPSHITTGETLAAMAERMRRVCLFVARRYPDCAVALVSHRDPIVALRLSLTGGDFDALNRTRCVQGSITECVTTGGKLSFVRYVEPDHEEGPPKATGPGS